MSFITVCLPNASPLKLSELIIVVDYFVFALISLFLVILV